MEKYLTSEQVADLLQVHPFTVLKYLKTGVLEGVKIGRMYRIKESDVEKFLGNITIKTVKPVKKEEKPSQQVETEVKSESKSESKVEYYQIL